MNCERATALLIDSLVDRLDDADVAELEEHLANCESCAAEAEAYRGGKEKLSRRHSLAAEARVIRHESHPKPGEDCRRIRSQDFDSRLNDGDGSRTRRT